MNHTLFVGIIGGVAPRYSGSSSSEGIVFPLIEGKYGESFQYSSVNGISYSFELSDRTVISPNIKYKMGRSDDDINNMGNLTGSIDGGVRLKHKILSNTYFVLDASTALSDNGHNGSYGSVSFQHLIRTDYRITYLLQGKIKVGDDHFMNAYYGVNTFQALRSGHRKYNADAGLESAGINATINYQLDRRWNISTTASYEKLLGSAKDSPTTDNENQWMGFIGISYKLL